VKQKGWTVDEDVGSGGSATVRTVRIPRARGDHMRIVSTSRAGAALPLFGKR